jgi:hypothetical protein
MNATQVNTNVLQPPNQQATHFLTADAFGLGINPSAPVSWPEMAPARGVLATEATVADAGTSIIGCQPDPSRVHRLTSVLAQAYPLHQANENVM